MNHDDQKMREKLKRRITCLLEEAPDHTLTISTFFNLYQKRYKKLPNCKLFGVSKQLDVLKIFSDICQITRSSSDKDGTIMLLNRSADQTIPVGNKDSSYNIEFLKDKLCDLLQGKPDGLREGDLWKEIEKSVGRKKLNNFGYTSLSQLLPVVSNTVDEFVDYNEVHYIRLKTARPKEKNIRSINISQENGAGSSYTGVRQHMYHLDGNKVNCQDKSVPQQKKDHVQQKPVPQQTKEHVQKKPIPQQTMEHVQQKAVPQQTMEYVQRKPVPQQQMEHVQQKPIGIPFGPKTKKTQRMENTKESNNDESKQTSIYDTKKHQEHSVQGYVNGNILHPRTNIRQQKLFVSKDELDIVAKDCIERLTETKKYVSVENIENLLKQHYGVSSLSGINVSKIEHISSVNEHVRTQAKVNAYIQAFIKVRAIVTLYELGEALTKFVTNESDFESLQLGPLTEQPLIYQFFRFPSDSVQIPQITTADILENLRRYLTENNLWTNKTDLEGFMKYMSEMRGFQSPYELGVRITSIALAIQVTDPSILCILMSYTNNLIKYC